MKTKLLLLATLLAGGWTSVAHGQETDAETDYTSWLNNPTCTENDGWAWTRAASNEAAGYIVSNAKLNSSVYTGNGVEYWSSSTSDVKNKDLLWQVVRNLPAGKYKVTAYAAGRNEGATNSTDDDSNNTTLNFFGNGATQQVTDMTWQSCEVEATVGNDGVSSPLGGREDLGGLEYAYDLVYSPLHTQFMKDCEKAGAKTACGLSMLIYQAVVADEIFLGLKDTDRNRLFAAAERAVKKELK